MDAELCNTRDGLHDIAGCNRSTKYGVHTHHDVEGQDEDRSLRRIIQYPGMAI